MTISTLNPALKDFWLRRTNERGETIRNRVLYGGRDSSKSWDTAGFACYLASQYRLRILCVRQYQNKIEESVYVLLKHQIERFQLSHQFRVMENKIICRDSGSEFIFYGLWRSIDEIKSLHGIDILWIEEAQNLSEEQWDILQATIRKEGSQVWIVFNPRFVTDFVYRRFIRNPPPGTLVRKINYDENPFLSNTSKDMIRAMQAEDHEKYQHIYGGVPRDGDDNTIIRRAWAMAAIDAHRTIGIGESGRKRIGFDIADGGADKCAAVYAHGAIVRHAEMWQAGEDELLKSCTRAWQLARSRQAAIVYDSIGVGASAGARFGELNDGVSDGRVAYSKFNAGGAVCQPEAHYMPNVQNRDHFQNLKAQAWWMLADRFRNTYNAVRHGQKFDDDQLISLDSSLPHLQELIDELSTPKREFDNNGKVKVESKKDLSRRDIASPNLADALVMAFAPGERQLLIDADTIRQFATMGRTRR